MRNSAEDSPGLLGNRASELERMAGELKIVRDVAGGYTRIKGEATEYLPRHPKETPENYAIRLNRPAFFNAFGRTVEGLTGMVFREDPKLSEDVPEEGDVTICAYCRSVLTVDADRNLKTLDDKDIPDDCREQIKAMQEFLDRNGGEFRSRRVEHLN